MFARFDPPSAPNYLTAVRDSDPSETAEWLDALESVFNMASAKRAEFILAALDRKSEGSRHRSGRAALRVLRKHHPARKTKRTSRRYRY